MFKVSARFFVIAKFNTSNPGFQVVSYD